MVSLLVLIIIIVIGIIYESSKNSESYSSKTKEYSTKTEESIGEYIERTRKEYLKTHTEKEWEEFYANTRRKAQEIADLRYERQRKLREEFEMATPTGDYFSRPRVDGNTCFSDVNTCKYCTHKHKYLAGDHKCICYNGQIYSN